MKLSDLITLLRQETQIKDLNVQIEIEPDYTVSHANIDFPSTMRPILEALVEKHNIRCALWIGLGQINGEPWGRLEILITL
ncbi:hypothetical protein FHR70_001654 [Microvirga lupini]|uniref:Uncharacterized protein n=1 Tax=Microvirga lupini TaxID=420324 RepID=A0A7W4VKV1_9HYPH|nr:hypothetical protein [Microvirga lupini]MBB3018600.1 hypothetical protein [Microvirga lupini]